MSTTPAPNQPYGMAQDQQQAMATIPLPKVAGPGELGGAQDSTGNPPVPTAGPGGTPVAPSPGGTPGPASPDPLAEALTAAAMTPPPGPGLFDAPTTRPDEDLMAPAATMTLGRRTPVADVLRQVAENNGNDPALRALATSAARRGF
jgi:hypothetical protein